MRIKLILLGLLCFLPVAGFAKSHSLGSHSYSSKSASYSSGNGGSYASSFTKSFGSSFSSSGKTYSSWLPKTSSASTYSAGSSGAGAFASPSRKTTSFDSDAASAQQHQDSQKAYSTWKTANSASSLPGSTYTRSPGNNYYPTAARTHWSYASQSYHYYYSPTPAILFTRPTRLHQTFYLYYDRPSVYYNDPYSSLFWWWLLDQSIDSRAEWAYNHRDTMDPARYQLLLSNADLASRVQALEAQQAERDNSFTPAGMDQDLMYKDSYVQHPGPAGQAQGGQGWTARFRNILFWLFAIPAAFCVGAFVIWGVFFKRWNTA